MTSHLELNQGDIDRHGPAPPFLVHGTEGGGGDCVALINVAAQLHPFRQHDHHHPHPSAPALKKFKEAP
ncbi:MAG: hypothetical protein R6V60_08950 [Desulfobacterales bacterium]